MKKAEIIRIFLSPIIELSMLVGVFFLAYSIRGITDGIPFIGLKIPNITYDQFVPFVVYGVFLWGIVFGARGLYHLRDDMPIFAEVQMVLRSSFIWFIAYISFVYMTLGFVFEKEIPRLIIIYTYILSTIFSISIRILRHTIYSMLYRDGYIEKNILIVLYTKEQEKVHLEENSNIEYKYMSLEKKDTIQSMIRDRTIDGVMSLAQDNSTHEIRKIIELSHIYGIAFFYPKIIRGNEQYMRREVFIGDIAAVELLSISISAWERIIKRTIDIMLAGIGLIVLSPVFLIIALIIRLEDSSGPVFFANRRIGQDGKIFHLYKFRYMYWKYSVKDAYGVDESKDTALRYEEKLKKKNDIRNGPLYKIEDDPRKMKFGSILEKLSLDELPQLYNVLIGDMSLVGPRPHQPREVDLYDEEDTQVLTVKPGITGMAQVYGREKNSFKEEVALDRYYIENYSLWLDIAIFLRTFAVVISRIWKK